MPLIHFDVVRCFAVSLFTFHATAADNRIIVRVNIMRRTWQGLIYSWHAASCVHDWKTKVNYVATNSSGAFAPLALHKATRRSICRGDDASIMYVCMYIMYICAVCEYRGSIPCSGWQLGMLGCLITSLWKRTHYFEFTRWKRKTLL